MFFKENPKSLNKTDNIKMMNMVAETKESNDTKEPNAIITDLKDGAYKKLYDYLQRRDTSSTYKVERALRRVQRSVNETYRELYGFESVDENSDNLHETTNLTEQGGILQTIS